MSKHSKPAPMPAAPGVTKAVTGMSAVEGLIWAFAIMGTCGFAYPAYRARKHKLDRTTRYS